MSNIQICLSTEDTQTHLHYDNLTLCPRQTVQNTRKATDQASAYLQRERRRIDGYHHHHQSLDREGRWGTTDDVATSFLHFPLFSTALWDLANSRPVHSLMLSSHLFLCLPEVGRLKPTGRHKSLAYLTQWRNGLCVAGGGSGCRGGNPHPESPRAPWSP